MIKKIFWVVYLWICPRVLFSDMPRYARRDITRFTRSDIVRQFASQIMLTNYALSDIIFAL